MCLFFDQVSESFRIRASINLQLSVFVECLTPYCKDCSEDSLKCMPGHCIDGYGDNGHYACVGE